MAGQALQRSAQKTPSGPQTRRLMRACAHVQKQVRLRLRVGLQIGLLGAALLLPQAAIADPAPSQPIRAIATLTSPDNAYGRLVLQFSDAIPTEVTMAGSILVVHFAKPVDIAVDDLGDALPAYVGGARRDPDGTAIRIALNQMVKVNTMTAGERVFVDLLPEKWTGPPPSLPPEVIKELSDRAIAAERALREQELANEAKKRPPVRVRAGVQPTFVRFVFELPDGVNVSSSLNANKYTLSFSAPLTFDLADAKITAPSNVKSITQAMDRGTSSVDIGLIGEVDVHGFRDDKNYVVDIGFDSKKSAAAMSSVILPEAALPHPAKTEPAPAPQKTSAVTPEKAGETPVQKTDVAHQANANVAKPAPATQPPVKPLVEAAAEPAAQKPPVVEAIAPAAVKAAEAAPGKKEVAAEPSQPQMPPVPEQHAQAPAPPASQPKPSSPSKSAGLPVTAKRTTDDFRIVLPFEATTPVAVFRRSDAVWIVAADQRPLDVSAITTEGGNLITGVSVLPVKGGQAIRIKLARPQLPSIVAAGSNLSLVLSERDQSPSLPLVAIHNVADPSVANVTIAFPDAGPLLHVTDPEIGDTLAVVTGRLPARGFTRRQNFVEFSLLDTTQGVVVSSHSDDVSVKPSSGNVLITRPGGLTLSAANAQPDRAATAPSTIFDVNEWTANQKAPFLQRLDALTTAASAASDDKKLAAHIALADFYLSRGFYQEAKGVMDLALLKPPASSTALPTAIMVRAVAETLAGHPKLALKDIDNPAVGSGYDAQLWMGMANARLGKWPDAREKFKNSEFSVISLPLDLQRLVLLETMRACLEMKDYSGATARANDLQTLGVAPDQKARLALLRGRLSEALGSEKDALASYHEAAVSSDRPIAAEAGLDEIALLQKRNEIKDADALRELERLDVIWRGDATEARNLRMMSKLYIKTGQYAEGLAAAMQATKLDPDSESARALQDQAADLFSEIFLTDKGDSLPPVKALALFYQYRDLTPIGRRGDEMIRRLADRLVAVDLLDQAGDLLQYQVDKRLEGAARAQVAARLAMVYLMNHKPERAIAALRSTRIGDLAGEVREQRLLLEARAQSEIGRNDLALDIISNMNSHVATRLRSDILWSMRRWRESAEQIEVMYGDRWKDFQPLTDGEKGDIIRAAIGYALANDSIGLGRFRDKYAPKMESAADKSAFAIASKPSSGDPADLERIAKMAARVDTLEGFLREMRERFPDAVARAKLPAGLGDDDDATGALPKIVGKEKVSDAR